MRKHDAHAHGAHAPEAHPSVDELKKLGYEGRDVAIPTLRKWLRNLFLFIVVMFAMSYGVYKFFVPQGAEQVIGGFPQAVIERRPPEPILQAHPKRDMYLFRREEEEVLRGYGWVDPNRGVVRIPIERAIDLTAERGLPTPRASAMTGGANPPPRTGAGGTRSAPETTTGPKSATPGGFPIAPRN